MLWPLNFFQKLIITKSISNTIEKLKYINKNIMNPKIILIITLAFLAQATANAQVGIGTTSPDETAILEVQSTTKGFLPPRMDTDARDDISNPAEALVIYNTDSKCLEVFDNADWISICDGSVVTTTPYSSNYVHCNSSTEVIEVISTDGKIWMDRNLGATQVATAFNDTNAYGDLFQWGRFADGHQCRESDTYLANNILDETGVPLANTPVPNAGNAWDGKFIDHESVEIDWLSPKDDNLWQGVNGINNPCPTGFRLPTNPEWETERLSWDMEANGAFGSTLKLPLAGYRAGQDTTYEGSAGVYWSSTVEEHNDIHSGYVVFNNSLSEVNSDWWRIWGSSVRCIKD